MFNASIQNRSAKLLYCASLFFLSAYLRDFIHGFAGAATFDILKGMNQPWSGVVVMDKAILTDANTQNLETKHRTLHLLHVLNKKTRGRDRERGRGRVRGMEREGRIVREHCNR